MIQNDLGLRVQIGERIRSKRGDASQQAFAKKLKISRGYLSDLERGARRLSVHTLVGICKAMKTTPSKLLGFSEKPKQYKATPLMPRTQAG